MSEYYQLLPFERTQNYLDAIEPHSLRSAVARLLQMCFHLAVHRLENGNMFGGNYEAAMQERGIDPWTEHDVLDVYLMETARDEMLRADAFHAPSVHDFYQLR